MGAVRGPLSGGAGPLSPEPELRFLTASGRLRVAWLCVGVHACALLATVLVLVHGLPPGDLLARREFVAAHALAWGLAWVPWMLASFSVILLFVAWADTLPYRGWSLLALGLTLAGALLDWVQETVWILLAPAWAAHARDDPFQAGVYALWDRAYVVLSLGLANLLYTLGGALLTAIAFRTAGFPRWLAWGSVPVWACSFALSGAAVVGDDRGIVPASAGLFALFLPWVALLGHGWLAGVRPGAAPPARLAFREVVRGAVPKHPIPMRTVFRECFLVNFAVRAEALRRLLGGPIEPDLHRGEAYLSIVIAEMERMRPAFLPGVFGVTYAQVVYRAVVRCRGERGVHFLRSDADHRLMSLAGDWLTFFRFHYSRASLRREGSLVHFDLAAGPGHHADIHATYDLGRGSRALPPTSRFATLTEARGFLVELFAAFAYDPLTERVSTVRIERGPWDLLVVEDRRARYDFMRGSALFPPGTADLDSVFYVKALPYHWHRLERPRPAGGAP